MVVGFFINNSSNNMTEIISSVNYQLNIKNITVDKFIHTHIQYCERYIMAGMAANTFYYSIMTIVVR